MAQSKSQSIAKINLRMWSDSVAFSNASGFVGLQPEIIYSKGDATKLPNGTLSNHKSSRNYISFDSHDVNNKEMLYDIIDTHLNNVSECAFRNEIATGNVDAVIWLAVFAPGQDWANDVPSALKAKARDRNVKILVENYACPDENGVPTVIYL